MILRVVPEGGPVAAYVQPVAVPAGTNVNPSLVVGVVGPAPGLLATDDCVPMLTSSFLVGAGWPTVQPMLLGAVPFAADVVLLALYNPDPINPTGASGADCSADVLVVRRENLRQ